MGTTAITNLLQITTTARQVSEPARPSSSGADLFREHLQRASGVAEPTQNPDSDRSNSKIRNNDLEKPDAKRDASTDEDHGASGTVERTAEAEVQSVDQPEEEVQDEVTLSEEAITAAESEAETGVETAEDIQVDLANVVAIADAPDTNAEQQRGEQVVDQAETIQLESEPKDENAQRDPTREALTPLETEADDVSTRQTPTDELTPTAGQSDLPAAEEVATQAAGTNTESQVAPGSTGAVPIPQTANSQQAQVESSERQELPLAGETTGAEERSSKRKTPQSASALTQTLDAEQPSPNSELSPASPAPTSPSVPSAAPTSVLEIASTSQSLDQGTNTPSTAVDSAPVEETAPTPPVDRARFVQRVSGAFRAAQEHDGQIRVRLSPPELGALRIEIAVKQGVLTAQLETETVAARNLILDNLPALRERLAEQEIRIEKFDVDVRDESSPQNDQAETKDRQTRDAAEERSTTRTDSTETSTANTHIGTTTTLEPDGSLDVMI